MEEQRCTLRVSVSLQSWLKPLTCRVRVGLEHRLGAHLMEMCSVTGYVVTLEPFALDGLAWFFSFSVDFFFGWSC